MSPPTLPEPVQPTYLTPTGQQPIGVPPGYIVGYTAGGVPTYVPQQPAVVNLQAPEATIPPWLVQLIIVTFLILAVVTVCVGAICAVVVLMGGTLIGIIGVVGAQLPLVAATLIGAILAAGWAASKLKGVLPTEKAGKRKR